MGRIKSFEIYKFCISKITEYITITWQRPTVWSIHWFQQIFIYKKSFECWYHNFFINVKSVHPFWWKMYRVITITLNDMFNRMFEPWFFRLFLAYIYSGLMYSRLITPKPEMFLFINSKSDNVYLCQTTKSFDDDMTKSTLR